VWGAVLIIGMRVGAVVHPHLVTPTGLRVRAGAGVDLHVPWEVIVESRRVRRDHPGLRAAWVDDGVLSVGVGNATTVAVTLDRPVTARLPQGPVEVTAVHLHVDDAAGLVSAARVRLGGTTGRR
jgi:hypothetical protein